MAEAATGDSAECVGAALPNSWDALGVARTSSNAEESSETEKSLAKASLVPIGMLVDERVLFTLRASRLAKTKILPHPGGCGKHARPAGLAFGRVPRMSAVPSPTPALDHLIRY